MNGMARKDAQICFHLEASLRDKIARRIEVIGMSRQEYLRSLIIADLDLTVDELIALNRSDDAETE